MNDMTALILAGGKSAQMKKSKADLVYQGRSFLRLLIAEMRPYYPVAISRSAVQDFSSYKCPQYVDLHEGIGAMGGIHAGLRAIDTEDVFVVSCDTPTVPGAFATYLSNYRSGDCDAVVPVMRNGKVCPTVAIYNHRALPVVERFISSDRYTLLACLKELRVKYVPLNHTVFPDSMLIRINTPEDYRAFLRMGGEPPLVAISGVKKSGKTTLLTKILPVLIERGYRVATIKHDAHEFEGDVKGTDTYQHFAAGALGTAIFSSTKFMLIKRQPGVDARQLRTHFADADLILLEGFKYSKFPKIEIVRKEISQAPVGIPETILAIASDCLNECGDIPVYSLDDIPALCDVIESYIKEYAYA